MSDSSEIEVPHLQEDPVSLEDAKGRVQALGNAFAVKRRLEEIAEDENNINRWAWELLQNARDAAGKDRQVCVRVSYDGESLTFEHDGPPFRSVEIAHLILHGSTKHDDHAGIGRFGTGFITTHLLSLVVRVRGPLDDGRAFDFDLDRRGKNVRALEESMSKSWDAMMESLKPFEGDVAKQLTTFVYPIAPTTRPVVMSGLDELRRVATFLLAFNPQFTCLTVENQKDVVTYRVRDRSALDEGGHRISVVDDSGADRGTVFVVERDGIQLAVSLAPDGDILPDGEMSRVFVAFPLVATAGFPLPATMNCERFQPRTERDGIFLEAKEAEKSTWNRPLFQTGCSLFGPLAEEVAKIHPSAIPLLLALDEPHELRSVDVEWLKESIRATVTDVAGRNVLPTRSGTLIEPQTAVIPMAEEGRRASLWKLCSLVKELQERLPPADTIDLWNEVIESWKFFTTSVAARKEEFSLERIAELVEANPTVTDFANKVEGDVWEWLRNLLCTIREHEATELCKSHELLPGQDGVFRTSEELFHDKDIPLELKLLAEEAGLPGRAELLATELSNCEDLPDLEERDVGDVLENLSEGFGQPTEDNRDVLVRTFAFVVERRMKNWLHRIPIITASTSLKTVSIELEVPPRERLLAPVLRWPKGSEEFGELFPAVCLMDEAYAAAITDDAAWTWLAEIGAVLPTPLVKDAQVQEFIVEKKEADKETKRVVRSKESLEQWHIAHLNGRTSVLERIRDSQRSGVLFIRFLIEYVVPSERTACETTDVDCDDGESRKCHRAAWIVELRQYGWVRRSYPSATSLAELLRDEAKISSRLLEPQFGLLLEGIGVSPADLALRSVGKTETDRMSLIRSLGVITDAIGHDPTRVAAFAETVQKDATVLAYIQQRTDIRARIARNQSFGFAAERMFRASFRDEAGVEIQRTGHGSDFSLTPIEAGEENDGGVVEISLDGKTVLVELKATRGSDAVHMSVTQVQKATTQPERYWLCVVEVEQGDVTSELIRSNARFVCDIGTSLESAWSNYEELEDATPSPGEMGDASLEVLGQEVRFRIGRKLWASGITFDEAVKKLRPGIVLPAEPVKVDGEVSLMLVASDEAIKSELISGEVQSNAAVAPESL